MFLRHDSVQFLILDRLCQMPKAVRGMAPAMLQREFGDLAAVDKLAAMGLVKKRGWANGPGCVWVPTATGEALHLEMSTAPHHSPSITSGDRVLLPDGRVRDPVKADQRSS